MRDAGCGILRAASCKVGKETVKSYNAYKDEEMDSRSPRFDRKLRDHFVQRMRKRGFTITVDDDLVAGFIAISWKEQK